MQPCFKLWLLEISESKKSKKRLIAKVFIVVNNLSYFIKLLYDFDVAQILSNNQSFISVETF